MTARAEIDYAQLDDESFDKAMDALYWSDRRSGLEMLFAKEIVGVAESPEDQWLKLAKCRATPATWREYRGAKRLRPLVLYALHHYLDPRPLGLTEPTNDHVLAIVQGQPLGSVLAIFLGRCRVLMDDIVRGKVRVVERAYPWEHCLVDVEYFTRLMAGERVLKDPCSALEETDVDATSRTPSTYSSPYVEAVVAAQALFVPVSRGGDYVPGDFRTVPDVDGFLRKHYPSISPTKRRQICEIVRPPELPKGRRPKNDRAHRCKE